MGINKDPIVICTVQSHIHSSVSIAHSSNIWQKKFGSHFVTLEFREIVISTAVNRDDVQILAFTGVTIKKKEFIKPQRNANIICSSNRTTFLLFP